MTLRAKGRRPGRGAGPEGPQQRRDGSGCGCKHGAGGAAAEAPPPQGGSASKRSAPPRGPEDQPPPGSCEPGAQGGGCTSDQEQGHGDALGDRKGRGRGRSGSAAGRVGGPAPRGRDREEEQDRQAEATQVSGQTPQRCILLQRNQNHGLGACRVRHKCLYCPSSGQGWRPAGGPAGRRAARRWPGWAHRWAASRVKAAGEGLSCSEAPAKDWQPRSCRGHQPWWDAAVLLQGHGAIIHTLLCLFHTARSAPR